MHPELDVHPTRRRLTLAALLVGSATLVQCQDADHPRDETVDAASSGQDSGTDDEQVDRPSPCTIRQQPGPTSDGGAGPSAGPPSEGGTNPNVSPPPGGTNPSEPPTSGANPTSVSTVAQAYYCIFDHYFSGAVLDARSILVPAFAGLTQELQRRGLDQANATLPVLIGKKNHDWTAFRATYETISSKLSDAAAQEALADSTIAAMIEALHDNHVHRGKGLTPDVVGVSLSAYKHPGEIEPVARPPLYVTKLTRGLAADKAGVRAGDEIISVNDLPPYVNGILSEGVLTSLVRPAQGAQISVVVHRPATDATLTVTVSPATGPNPPPPAGEDDPRLLENVAYVPIRGFQVDIVQKAVQALRDLASTMQLRGVVLDLRGNGGGDPDAVAKLLGAFVHDKVTGYSCDVFDRCTALRTDDTVPLVNLRMVALVDRVCASACDHFAGAVKDLHLGLLVGTRTSGTVSGAADDYLLEDGSTLALPQYHGAGANGEVIDSIGVAADYFAPLTAADLSAGNDPGLAKAIELLR